MGTNPCQQNTKSRYWIVSTRMPRPAFDKPLESHPTTFGKAIAGNGNDRVLRAAWNKPASPGEERGYSTLIEPDKADQGALGETSEALGRGELPLTDVRIVDLGTVEVLLLEALLGVMGV